MSFALSLERLELASPSNNQVARLWVQNLLLNNFLCSLAHMEQTTSNPLSASNIHDAFSSQYTWPKSM